MRCLQEQASLILAATMFNLCDENCLSVENSFLILLKEGTWESPEPPLMPLESETERNGLVITSTFVDWKTMIFYHLLGKASALCLTNFQNDERQKSRDLNLLPKVSIWGPSGEVSACGERRRTRRGSRRLLIRCCRILPSEGTGNSSLVRPQNCQFPGVRNLFRDKIFLD